VQQRALPIDVAGAGKRAKETTLSTSIHEHPWPHARAELMSRTLSIGARIVALLGAPFVSILTSKLLRFGRVGAEGRRPWQSADTASCFCFFLCHLVRQTVVWLYVYTRCILDESLHTAKRCPSLQLGRGDQDAGAVGSALVRDSQPQLGPTCQSSSSPLRYSILTV
jgi:hypothetical protein